MKKQVGFVLSTKAQNIVIRLVKKHKANKSEIVEALIRAYDRFGMPYAGLSLQLEDLRELKKARKERSKHHRRHDDHLRTENDDRSSARSR